MAAAPHFPRKGTCFAGEWMRGLPKCCTPCVDVTVFEWVVCLIFFFLSLCWQALVQTATWAPTVGLPFIAAVNTYMGDDMALTVCQREVQSGSFVACHPLLCLPSCCSCPLSVVVRTPPLSAPHPPESQVVHVEGSVCGVAVSLRSAVRVFCCLLRPRPRRRRQKAVHRRQNRMNSISHVTAKTKTLALHPGCPITY